MTIVIPMAGASSRFYDAGYLVPKYMLPVSPESNMFKESVKSFDTYFSKAEFIFVVNSAVGGDDITDTVRKYCNELGIKFFRIYDIRRLTRGQAETVFEALQYFRKEDSSESLTIFNIDTILKNWTVPVMAGYCKLGFHAFNDPEADKRKYSFARTLSNTPGDVYKNYRLYEEGKSQTPYYDYILKDSAEKEKVGPWCSTGLYWFSEIRMFSKLYRKAQHQDSYNYYIAPLFAVQDSEIEMHERLVFPCKKEDVTFVGVPEEYETYIKQLEAQE